MNAKVLLVDDSSTALLMAETILKQHTTYEVVTARDGKEAVQKAEAEKPDLILMDVVMPRMDGFAACREIRKQEHLKSMPIIMVTSRGEPINVEMGYRSGCDAYLTKPISPTELLEMVRTLLGTELDDDLSQPDSPATREGRSIV
ncbi:MAG TPA: response regulator [Candidatus Saccharimonadales bacterium]|jgi:CheY-like chemotaxis protein|nr:response regulator [Candidatus Saccharimonadales bacterium]